MVVSSQLPLKNTLKLTKWFLSNRVLPRRSIVRIEFKNIIGLSIPASRKRKPAPEGVAKENGFAVDSYFKQADDFHVYVDDDGKTS